MRRFVAVLLLAMFASQPASGQAATKTFTRADTLRGSNGPGRAWWDATFYELHVTVNPADSSVRGRNAITYRVLSPAKEMQIDLQVPLEIDSVVQDARPVTFR